MTVFATMFANFRPDSFHFSSSLEYLPFYVSNPSISPPQKKPREPRCPHLHPVNAPSLPELLSFIFYLYLLNFLIISFKHIQSPRHPYVQRTIPQALPKVYKNQPAPRGVQTVQRTIPQVLLVRLCRT